MTASRTRPAPLTCRSTPTARRCRSRGGLPCPPDIPPIGLSVTETVRIERLDQRTATAGLITRARLAFDLRWSHWRRRHQARARWHHYAARLEALAT